MRQVYNRSFAVTFLTGDSGYVFADKVPPGHILHVHSCVGYSAQREASDDVLIGIREAGTDLYLTAKAPLAAQRAVDVPKDFFAGEGDQIFAYFPDADNTDVLEVHINGVLLKLTEWEAGLE